MLLVSLVAVALLANGAGSHEVGGSVPAGAYPIAPVPLLELFESADFIGVVHVERINGESEKQTAFWGPADSKIEVEQRECWLGDADQSELVIRVNLAIVCPNPPKYALGEDRLVFLEKRGSGFVTVGLSYGSKSTDHLKLYRAAFERWQRMREQVRGQSLEERRRAEYLWQLDLVFVPELRNEALYSLVPEAFDVGLSRREADYRAWLLKTHPAILRGLADEISLEEGFAAGAVWALWATVDPLLALDWLELQMRRIPANAGRDRLSEARSFCYAVEGVDFPVIAHLEVVERVDRLGRCMRPYDGSDPSPSKIEWARSEMRDYLSESRDEIAAYVLASSR